MQKIGSGKRILFAGPVVERVQVVEEGYPLN